MFYVDGSGVHMSWSSVQAPAALLGALLCIAALGYLLFGPTGRSGFALANGTLNGLALGLVGGLVGGLLVELTQVASGLLHFTITGGFDAGLALGLGCGVLTGFALARLGSLPHGLALGVLAGTAVGLAAFRLAFGPGAGFGPELDQGVGPEIGLLFGMFGGLVGGLTGTLVDTLARQRQTARTPPADGAVPSPVAAIRWRVVVLASALGAVLAGLLALVGWLSGLFLLILPRFAQIPDVQQPQTPLDSALGVLYGIGVFAVGGALVGGLAGALANNARVTTSTRLHWLGLTVGLSLGLAAGFASGLAHGDVGGPLLFGPQPIYDPAASRTGLVVGLLGGGAFGILCAVMLRQVERRPARRAPAFALVLLAIGLSVALMPAWFHPLFGVDVP